MSSDQVRKIDAGRNVPVEMRVNGEDVEVSFAPYKTLLEVLREDLDLTGTKHGCELGECGACAVLLDGEPVLSCLVLAVECEGRSIETVEGLARGAELHPLQAAFADLGGAQCGYCTPGILMTAKALLDARAGARPASASRRRSPATCAAAPAICRSTSRSRRPAADALRRRECTPAAPPPEPNHERKRGGAPVSAGSKERFDVIGKPRRRVDGRAKVTGQTRFADDIVLPRMLHARLLRSPHPHARIVAIDVTRAAQHPGVHLVLTGKDFPVTFGILPVSQDEYPLAPERVRYVGDPVAAVVAKDEQTAGEALDLIDVTYEILPTIASPEEALAHPEARIHDYNDHGNIHRNQAYEFGDVDAALAQVRPRVRGPLLLRGQHAPADRAARGGRGRRRRGQAHALVVDAGAALRAPADGARAARCPRRTSASSPAPTAAASAARPTSATTRRWC